MILRQMTPTDPRLLAALCAPPLASSSSPAPAYPPKAGFLPSATSRQACGSASMRPYSRKRTVLIGPASKRAGAVNREHLWTGRLDKRQDSTSRKDRFRSL